MPAQSRQAGCCTASPVAVIGACRLLVFCPDVRYLAHHHLLHAAGAALERGDRALNAALDAVPRGDGGVLDLLQLRHRLADDLQGSRQDTPIA